MKEKNLLIKCLTHFIAFKTNVQNKFITNVYLYRLFVFSASSYYPFLINEK